MIIQNVMDGNRFWIICMKNIDIVDVIGECKCLYSSFFISKVYNEIK